MNEKLLACGELAKQFSKIKRHCKGIIFIEQTYMVGPTVHISEELFKENFKEFKSDEDLNEEGRIIYADYDGVRYVAWEEGHV